MNQRQLLVLSFVLYIIPVPFISWGGLIISATATGYRTEHIKSIKVFLVFYVLAILGYLTAVVGIGIVILIIGIIWYYWYMISNLLKAMQLKDEVMELKDEVIKLKD